MSPRNCRHGHLQVLMLLHKPMMLILLYTAMHLKIQQISSNFMIHSTKFFFFRLDAVQQHVGTAEHVRLAAAQAQNQTKIVAGIQLAESKKRAAVITALKTEYLVIVEELPNCKYKALLPFLQHLNVESACYLKQGAKATYDSPTIFNELLNCLNDVSKNALKIKLNNSHQHLNIIIIMIING